VVLQIIVHPDHIVAMNMVQTRHDRGMLPEILRQVDPGHIRVLRTHAPDRLECLIP